MIVMTSTTKDIIYRVRPKTEAKLKMITICNKCHSSDFSYSSFQREDYTNCKNCGLSDTDTLYILETDKYKYPMKSRDDVNPITIRICNKCYSSEFDYSSYQREDYTNCNNCGLSETDTLQIKKCDMHLYPMKTREEVNPKMIHICAICYSPDFKYEDHQFESYQFCNNCGECNGERLYVKESQVRR